MIFSFRVQGEPRVRLETEYMGREGSGGNRENTKSMELEEDVLNEYPPRPQFAIANPVDRETELRQGSFSDPPMHRLWGTAHHAAELGDGQPMCAPLVRGDKTGGDDRRLFHYFLPERTFAKAAKA